LLLVPGRSLKIKSENPRQRFGNLSTTIVTKNMFRVEVSDTAGVRKDEQVMNSRKAVREGDIDIKYFDVSKKTLGLSHTSGKARQTPVELAASDDILKLMCSGPDSVGIKEEPLEKDAEKDDKNDDNDDGFDDDFDRAGEDEASILADLSGVPIPRHLVKLVTTEKGEGKAKAKSKSTAAKSAPKPPGCGSRTLATVRSPASDRSVAGGGAASSSKAVASSTCVVPVGVKVETSDAALKGKKHGADDPEQYILSNGGKEPAALYASLLAQIEGSSVLKSFDSSEEDVLKFMVPIVTQLKSVSTEYNKVYWKIAKRMTICKEAVLPPLDVLSARYRYAPNAFSHFCSAGFDRLLDTEKFDLTYSNAGFKQDDLRLRLRRSRYRSQFESMILFSQFEDLKLFVASQEAAFTGSIFRAWACLNSEIFEVNLQELFDAVSDVSTKGCTMLSKATLLIENIILIKGAERLFGKQIVVEAIVIKDAIDLGPSNLAENQERSFAHIKEKAMDVSYAGIFNTLATSKCFANIAYLIDGTLSQKKKLNQHVDTELKIFQTLQKSSSGDLSTSERKDLNSSILTMISVGMANVSRDKTAQLGRVLTLLTEQADLRLNQIHQQFELFISTAISLKYALVVVLEDPSEAEVIEVEWLGKTLRDKTLATSAQTGSITAFDDMKAHDVFYSDLLANKDFSDQLDKFLVSKLNLTLLSNLATSFADQMNLFVKKGVSAHEVVQGNVVS
jgi:hypothetical protein